jgi:hypothetical protein
LKSSICNSLRRAPFLDSRLRENDMLTRCMVIAGTVHQNSYRFSFGFNGQRQMIGVGGKR